MQKRKEVKAGRNLFKEIMGKKFSNLQRYLDIQVYEAHR